MEVPEVLYVEKDKYMWDGAIYESEEEARKKKGEYEGNRFQVELSERDGKYLLYTRRVVTGIVLEGKPPV